MAEDSSALAQQPEDGAEEEKPEGPKGPLIPPVLVRGAVIGGILAVLAVGAIFLVTDVIAPRIRLMGEPVASGEEKVEKAEKVKEGEPGEVLNVSDLLVNPAGTGGRRYLKVAAAIEIRAPHGKKEKAAHAAGDASLRDVQIRDLLIRELSSRTLEELTDPMAKEETRQGILAELNALLGEGRVTNLYFTEYVVQ